MYCFIKLLIVATGASPFQQHMNNGTVLTELGPDDADFIHVAEQMQNTIREHKDNCGGIFNRYSVLKVIF